MAVDISELAALVRRLIRGLRRVPKRPPMPARLGRVVVVSSVGSWSSARAVIGERKALISRTDSDSRPVNKPIFA